MLEWFHAEEKSIQNQLITIRHHRNERVPVNRLPDELLLAVFFRASRTSTDSWSGNRWVYITHVCRRWRDIAINSPHLWTQIDTTNFDCLTAFLQRSSPAKVDVICHSCEERDNVHFFDTLAPYASRVRRLDLSFDLYYEENMDLSSLSNLQMPNLEVFRFVSEAAPDYPFYVDAQIFLENEPDVHPFSPTWDEHGPHIRELSLRLVAIPWTSKVFCDLHSLELDGQNATEEYTPSMEAFLDVLQSCPRMEHLVVKYSGPTDDTYEEYLDPTWRPERRVELPRLRMLSLRNHATDIGYLLAHLIIPESAHISLECTATDTSGDGSENDRLAQIMGVATKRGNLKCLDKVISVKIACEVQHGQRMDFDGYDSNGGHVLSIAVTWGPYDVDVSQKPEQAIAFMEETLSTRSSIQELIVAVDFSYVEVECWRSAFRSMPDIHTLTFIDNAWDGSTAMLKDRTGSFLQGLDASPTSSTPILPRLRQLSLTKRGFHEPLLIQLKTVLVNRARAVGCMDELNIFYSGNSPLSFPDFDGLVRTFKHEYSGRR